MGVRWDPGVSGGACAAAGASPTGRGEGELKRLPILPEIEIGNRGQHWPAHGQLPILPELRCGRMGQAPWVVYLPVQMTAPEAAAVTVTSQP
jgi:hypothetical protein